MNECSPKTKELQSPTKNDEEKTVIGAKSAGLIVDNRDLMPQLSGVGVCLFVDSASIKTRHLLHKNVIFAAICQPYILSLIHI